MRAHSLIAVLITSTLCSQAQWMEFALPNTVNGGYDLSHLNDGRMVYSDSGTIRVQDAFGSSSFSTHTTCSNDTTLVMPHDVSRSSYAPNLRGTLQINGSKPTSSPFVSNTS